MSECVILFRNKNNNLLGFIHTGDPEEFEIFPTREEAEEFAAGSDFLQCGQADYQIVELDEI